MRVLHIITDLGDGGAEAVLFRLCTADAAGAPPISHHVVSLAGLGRYGPMLTARGIAVDALNMPAGRLTISGLVRLYNLLRDGRPDAVQTWMYHANLVGGVLARLAGIRSLAWGLRQGVLDPSSTKLSTRLVDWCSARLSRHVPRAIVSCSKSALAVHMKAGYLPSKLITIPNGYELDQFSPDSGARDRVRSSLGVDDGTFLIGMVARWHPVKDHRNLLSALTELNNRGRRSWHCILVGAGMDNENLVLHKLINESGLDKRVTLLGQRVDIPALMNAFDVHALTSHSEAFPNVVAESMACGTPCVVTDVGDASYIVGETGWVVPPASFKPLADAIETAMDMHRDSLEWSARRISCRARVSERFSLSTMVAEYRRVWGRLREQDVA